MKGTFEKGYLLSMAALWAMAAVAVFCLPLDGSKKKDGKVKAN